MKKEVLLLKQLQTNSINSIVAYKFFENLEKAKEFSNEHRVQDNEYLFTIVFNKLQEMSNEYKRD